MKKLLITLCLGWGAVAQAQSDNNPAIKDFGSFSKVPFATDMPDPSIDYKIVVEASEKIENPAEIYAPLEHVARMYNLHVYGGVPKSKLQVVLVIWGPSVPVILSDEAYKKKYGVANPNSKILEALKTAGVNLLACGQSVNRYEIDPKTINPNVHVALSRFTTVSTLQMKGYAFFKY